MNKNGLLVLAAILSAAFACIYFTAFSYMGSAEKSVNAPAVMDVNNTADERIYYYVQLGVFANPSEMHERVKGLQDKVYSYEVNNLTYFVCGISENKSESETSKELALAKGYDAYVKQISVADASIIELMESEQYALAFEKLN